MAFIEHGLKKTIFRMAAPDMVKKKSPVLDSLHLERRPKAKIINDPICVNSHCLPTQFEVAPLSRILGLSGVLTYKNRIGRINAASAV
jgi:hypothetical protein